MGAWERAGRPKLGGRVSLGPGLGWDRRPERQGQGTRTAGGNLICHRNNLGELEMGSGSGIGRGKKGPGHSSMAQKCG